MDAGQICFHCATTGPPLMNFFDGHMQHVEVAKPGIESEPQIQQRQILCRISPCRSGDGTHNPGPYIGFLTHSTTVGTPYEF